LKVAGGKIPALTPDESIAAKLLYSDTGPSFSGGIVFGVTNTGAIAVLDLDVLKRDWHFFLVSIE
jgi:hypothetical protein